MDPGQPTCCWYTDEGPQMKVTFEDRRLERIREKVEAGERLSYDDGLNMFRSNDLLALGYMADIVGASGSTVTSPNSTSIRPTFCVAQCRLCAFGKQKKDPTPTRCRSSHPGTESTLINNFYTANSKYRSPVVKRAQQKAL